MELIHIVSNLLNTTFLSGESKAMTRRAGQMAVKTPELGPSLELISQLFTTQGLGKLFPP